MQNGYTGTCVRFENIEHGLTSVSAMNRHDPSTKAGTRIKHMIENS